MQKINFLLSLKSPDLATLFLNAHKAKGSHRYMHFERVWFYFITVPTQPTLLIYISHLHIPYAL